MGLLDKLVLVFDESFWDDTISWWAALAWPGLAWPAAAGCLQRRVPRGMRRALGPSGPAHRLARCASRPAARGPTGAARVGAGGAVAWQRSWQRARARPDAQHRHCPPPSQQYRQLHASSHPTDPTPTPAACRYKNIVPIGANDFCSEWFNMARYVGKPILVCFNAGKTAELAQGLGDKELTAAALVSLKAIFGASAVGGCTGPPQLQASAPPPPRPHPGPCPLLHKTRLAPQPYKPQSYSNAAGPARRATARPLSLQSPRRSALTPCAAPSAAGARAQRDHRDPLGQGQEHAGLVLLHGGGRPAGGACAGAPGASPPPPACIAGPGPLPRAQQRRALPAASRFCAVCVGGRRAGRLRLHGQAGGQEGLLCRRVACVLLALVRWRLLRLPLCTEAALGRSVVRCKQAPPPPSPHPTHPCCAALLWGSSAARCCTASALAGRVPA
jgi:hypothetical protein